VIAKNAASYSSSAEFAALDIQRNAEFIHIPIYNLALVRHFQRGLDA